MSRTADINGMRLTMPAGWWVWEYDESNFHKLQFQKFSGGVKAMDAVALEQGHTLWLIELKDYRKHKRSKPSSVFHELAGKVRDTLAGLTVARLKADTAKERTLAQQALKSTQIRVVLQFAQSGVPHRLFPQVVDPADGEIQMRKAIKLVDATPIFSVGSLGDQNAALPWTTVDI